MPRQKSANPPESRPDSTQNAATFLDQIEFIRVKDQDLTEYIRISANGRTTLILAEAARDLKVLSKSLQGVGLLALTPSRLNPVQRRIETLEDSGERIYAVREPGFHRGAYVLPTQEVLGEPDCPLELAFDVEPISLSTVGSLSGQRAIMRQFFTGQSNFLYALSFALVGPILDLFPSYCESPFSEFYGETSIGKTRMLFAAASLYGAPFGAGSISGSWNGTAAGFQKMAVARQGLLLGLDEVSKIGFGDASQAQTVVETVFRLASGESRVRDDGQSMRYVRLSILSTTNRPIRLLIGSTANTSATEVRCITIPADTGSGWGCWNNLPEGFANGGEASNALLAELRQNHGWIGRRWLRRLARLRSHNEAGLRDRIAAYVAAYLARVAPGADGEDLRRAMSFAITYAAGQLACDLNVLPFRSVGGAVETIHRRAEAFRRGELVIDDREAALGIVRQHLAQHRAQLVDLDAGPAPALSTRAMDACPGFLATAHGRRNLFMRGTVMRAMFGPAYNARLRELEAEGRLVATDGLQTQTRVRRNRDKDRVYGFLVD